MCSQPRTLGGTVRYIGFCQGSAAAGTDVQRGAIEESGNKGVVVGPFAGVALLLVLCVVNVKCRGGG